MRADEVEVPTRLGDAPPFLPFRKPFDLNGWQLVVMLLTAVGVLSLEQFAQISDEPFEAGLPLSPMLLGRVGILLLGCLIVFIHPAGRLLPMWVWVILKHFYRGLAAVYRDDDDARGARYFPQDSRTMTRTGKAVEGQQFLVEPPGWWFFKRTPMAESYWARHVPYRMLLQVEPQGSLEMMTDQQRAQRWHSLAAGFKALQYPVQIVAQTRAEDVSWLIERAMPPVGSPLASLRAPIEKWASRRALDLMQRRVAVTCSAPDPGVLVEHVRDVATMLDESGLVVQALADAERQELFDQVYGSKRFYPHPSNAFGIDNVDWVTIAVREFPRHCVVGWVMFVIGQLPVDVGLYVEPDDGAWVRMIMDWFVGVCEIPGNIADTLHHDAARDLSRVEGKLKRNEDAIQRATMLLSMPRSVVPRVANRLRKAGAIFREATWEHEAGRMATLPIGGVPRVGVTRPYDGASVAACYPFGSSGLRSKGALIGVARDALEAVTLDMLDQALNAAMVVILGTTGAGKTFLMQLLVARSGLPFVLIDMKPHLDEIRHGDFYRFTMEAKGSYHVCRPGEPLPVPHPTAQTYNLASLSAEEIPAVLQAIAEQEWARALDSLEDRIFGIDELYWLGQTEAGQAFVERIVSQGRSVGFIGICATQEVSDALGNKRLAKAVTMSSMQFVLAQDPSVIDEVVDTLKLGGDARAELEKFQPRPGDEDAAKTRSALLRVGQRLCSLRIEASPEETALYTTKPSDRRAMRRAAVEELAWSR